MRIGALKFLEFLLVASATAGQPSVSFGAFNCAAVLSHDPAVVRLATELINIQSVTGNESPMVEKVSGWLRARGWIVNLQMVGRGRHNVFAHRPGIANPKVIFNTHFDTVPDYFPASRDGQYLCGRGACDVKSLTAAQLLAAEKLVNGGEKEIGLLFTVGEETNSDGMRKANELNLSPRYLIVGEPTQMKLASQHKGQLQLKLKFTGRAVHSGYPEIGSSAVHTMVSVLNDLAQSTWPRGPNGELTTANTGIVSGGKAANVLADHAEAEILIRVASSVAETRAHLERVVNGRAEIEILAADEPIRLGTVPGFEAEPVSFFTDIPAFDLKKSGTTALLWGPGSIHDAHTNHERILISDLVKSVDTYADLARKLLNGQVNP